MKAAIVTEAGKTPVYGEFHEPIVQQGNARVTVAASALTPLARGRASGTHYSSSGTFPFVAGVDGVGRLDDGRRVYFLLPEAPYGSMAERTVVRASQCIPLPDDLDDVTAAAIGNPGMSSSAALKEVAKLTPGETVLVNGATGMAGRLAVQIAKHLGAKKVIATGRNKEVLKLLMSIGADDTIALVDDADALEAAFLERLSAGVDVVVDYLWGLSAERLLSARSKAGNASTPFRFVQVGSASGQNITLPGAVLRSSAIKLMGSGIGSVPNERLVSAIEELLQSAVPAGFQIPAHPVPLTEVESAWSAGSSESRTVFTVV